MRGRLHRLRPGVTLIEILIFVSLLGMVSSLALPLLFSAAENRLLQQTISVVEQNGSQLMQTITLRVRNGERIILPLQSATGSFVALQTASGGTMPIIIGTSTGSLVLIRRNLRQVLSSPQVAIENFVVRNTSVSASRPSAHISFDVSRTIRVQTPRTYARHFETTVTLFPDDAPQGDPCGCAAANAWSCSGRMAIYYCVCLGVTPAYVDHPYPAMDCVKTW